MLELTPDQLLTTTRTVRKRLDLARPVPMGLIRECVEIATQAPSGGNRQNWHFVVVTDQAKRQALADIYRKGWEQYRAMTYAISQRVAQDPAKAPGAQRILDSADYLAAHLHEVPVHVIPCFTGRLDGKSSLEQAGAWGSILPAVWNFMLAARARELGTAWTTVHLFHEQEAADVLGIPFAKITQAALVPLAYTIGTDFAPGPRESLDRILHIDQW